MQNVNIPTNSAYIAAMVERPAPGTKQRTLTGGEITWTKTGLIHRAKDVKSKEREDDDWDDFE